MHPEITLWMSKGGKVGDQSSWPCDTHTKNLWVAKSHRRCTTDHRELEAGGDGSRSLYVGWRWAKSMAGSQRCLVWKPLLAYFIFQAKEKAVVIQQYQHQHSPVTDTWSLAIEAISELWISPKGQYWSYRVSGGRTFLSLRLFISKLNQDYI